MLLTVALVVVGCAIVVLFSREFGNFFKKMFAIRGMKLFLPLILVSTLVVYYEYWISVGLLNIKWVLHRVASMIADWLPFTGALLVANILVLMLVSVLPVAFANFLNKRRHYEPLRYAFVISMVLWLLTAILLTVSYSYS
ncbi:hypothetical protein [Legionella cardiaca]|uniref:Uncharacterized protein n=1 Tax=Legionella cardiaca TaxID=1071983 RepID=A0ABY8ARF2_9GAMM|nr:hypothetical protein [Legionella cardiaca]WED42339.1 hypothetical protein PXX05_10455 [Legionella cardiaca]